MFKYKVLIVEDEAIVAFDIESALHHMGYSVCESVSNYDDAIKSIQHNEPNIILMDINLKNSKDGIETAIAIKKIKDIPIIYITAFSDDMTIDRAIATNPVGYLLKPFKREELKTIMRLAFHKLSANNIIENKIYTPLGGGYYFDTTHELLYCDDIPIALSKNEKKLLGLLLASRGNIIHFDDIIYYIWDDKVVADATLRSLIYRLRCKIKPELIETIQGFGYRLIL